MNAKYENELRIFLKKQADAMVAVSRLFEVSESVPVVEFKNVCTSLHGMVKQSIKLAFRPDLFLIGWKEMLTRPSAFIQESIDLGSQESINMLKRMD